MKTLNKITLFYFSILFLSACSVNDPILPKGHLLQASGTQTTEPVEDDELSRRPTSAGDRASARTGPLMPYLINFDTAAYMNCPGDNLASDAVFFTLKLGSYGSGLQLHPEFKEALADINHLEERKKQLETAPLIKSRAQLSLSVTGYPDQVIGYPTKSNPVIETILLNHPYVLTNLAKDGISYRLAHNSFIELHLLWPGNKFFDLLPSLNTKHSVYLTYNNGTDRYPLSSEKGVHYGRYFNFDFSSNAKFLMQITEKDIQNEPVAGQWVCSPDLRFAIHRETQFIRNFYKENRQWFNENKLSAERECQEDNSVLTPWEQKLFSLLIKNRIFIYGKTIKWVKDSSGTNQPVILNEKCIAPVDPKYSCYNNQHTYRVEFEDSKCVPGNKTKVCPNYLSICVKHLPK